MPIPFNKEQYYPIFRDKVLLRITFFIAQLFFWNLINTLKEVVAQNNLVDIIEYQRTYQLEFNSFTEKIAELGMRKEINTINYDYSLFKYTNAVYIYATPKQFFLKSYVGAVFIIPIAGFTRTEGILCETNTSVISEIAKPIYKNDSTTCGSETDLVTKIQSLAKYLQDD